MGTWGAGLFDDDLALDVKALFDQLVGSGVEAENAAIDVTTQFAEIMADPDEGPVLSLALASLLMDNGVTNHPIIDSAGTIVKEGIGLGLWRTSGNALYQARSATYKALADRLKSSIKDQKVVTMSAKKKPKPIVGNVIEIPLSNGYFAYGHYVQDDPRYGGLLSLYDRISPTPLLASDLAGVPPMLPPIFAPHGRAVRSGRWRVIGSLPIGPQAKYLFRCGTWHNDFKVNYWFLWDGESETPIGPKLPDEYKNLEILILWDEQDIEDRISNRGKLEWLDKIH